MAYLSLCVVKCHHELPKGIRLYGSRMVYHNIVEHDHVTEPTGIINIKWNNKKGLLFDLWHKYNCNTRNWPYLKTQANTLHLDILLACWRKQNESWTKLTHGNVQTIHVQSLVCRDVSSPVQILPFTQYRDQFPIQNRRSNVIYESIFTELLSLSENICSSLGLKSKDQSKFIFVNWQHYVTF